MAHTHGEPPNAIVDWPSVGLSFANPDDSGLGGGGQGNVQTMVPRIIRSDLQEKSRMIHF